MLPDIINYVPDPKNGRPIANGKVYFLIAGYTAPDRDSDLDISKIAPVTADGNVVPQPIYTSQGGTLLVGSQVNQPQLIPDGTVNRVAVYDKCGKLVYQVGYNAVGPFVPADDLAATNSTVLVGGVEAGVIANKSKKIILIEDYLNFTASHTAAFELAITQAKVNSAVQIVIPNQRLNLICNEAGGVLSFAAAVVIDGLQNCDIVGCGEQSELFAATGGSGTNTFALFRIQNSNNVTFKNFKAEGDYVNHAGNGGSRSKFIWLTTFDRDNSSVDLQEMRGIHFENIECNNIGGFVGVARRGSGATYAPNIYDVTIKHCHGVDAAQNDNTIGLNFAKGGEISHNKFKNTPIQNPPPVLFVDVSRGCENIDVKHNVGEFFVFGMKSESSVVTEVYAPSKQINFISNELLECGDPNSLSAGEGTAAGATYALKVRSENSLVKNNKWTARTQLVTSGGLNTGILVALGDTAEGTVVVDDGNNGSGSEFGIIHNRIVADAATKTIIRGNVIRAKQVGILAQVDCDVDDNDIYGTSSYAVNLQVANNTRARRNKAFNCGTTGGAVYYQGDGGSGTSAGYFEFIDNEIHDSRGASAATNGYRFQAGEVYTNQYRLKPGTTIGLLGNVYFGDYIGLFDRDSVKYSGQINAATLAVTNGYNILNVTSVDANTVQINFKRAIPADTTPAPSIQYLVGGNFVILFGNTTSYLRLRCVDSTGALKAPFTFNIRG